MIDGIPNRPMTADYSIRDLPLGFSLMGEVARDQPHAHEVLEPGGRQRTALAVTKWGIPPNHPF